MTTIDPDGLQADLAQLRASQAIRRRRRYRLSCLDAHRAEILTLRHMGASLREIAQWLRQERRCRVSHSTVARFLAREARHD